MSQPFLFPGFRFDLSSGFVRFRWKRLRAQVLHRSRAPHSFQGSMVVNGRILWRPLPGSINLRQFVD